MGVKIHPSYQKCIQAVQEKTGRKYGAASWLANEIGVSRQILSYWSKVGFPSEHLDKLSRATGLRKGEIQTVTLEVSRETWHALSASAPNYTKQAVIHPEHKKRPGRPRKLALGPRSSPKIMPQSPAEQPMKAVGGFIPISADELANQREEARKAGADLSVKGRAK